MQANSTHPDYDAAAPVWSRARDVLAGEAAVKAAGTRYLPRLDLQSDEEYGAYKTRAAFFGATARTLDEYLDLVFRRTPVFALGAKLAKQKTVKRDCVALTFIPFAFHGPRHSRPEPGRLPLADIIAANLDHYRLDADYKRGLHFAALPTASVSGFDKAAPLRIGASTSSNKRSAQPAKHPALLLRTSRLPARPRSTPKTAPAARFKLYRGQVWNLPRANAITFATHLPKACCKPHDLKLDHAIELAAGKVWSTLVNA